MFSVPTLAFLIDSAGTGEWIVLFVVILVVVGPKRLPEVARKLGSMMAMFRRAADEFKDQLMSMDQEPVDNNYRDSYTPPDSTDEYDYTPPDEADYPGNEDVAAEWSGGGEDQVGVDTGEADGGGVESAVVDEAAIWEGGGSAVDESSEAAMGEPAGNGAGSGEGES